MPIPTALFETMTGHLNGTDGAAPAMRAAEVWHRLFKKFRPLLGPLSTDLLFERTLIRHASTFPWLPQPPLPAGEPGSLFRDFLRSLDGRDSESIAAVNRALLGTYTDLLADLIGEGLATRFLRAAFPPDTHNKTEE
jgi:hypothetical protein